MVSFDIDIKHWPTIAAFAAYLKTVPRPAWVKGITNHNTFHPNESEWRGVISMNSMRSTYIAKGWTSGPNLYLVAAAPNASDCGIWQMTPITRPGTHAGACNKDHLGVESCGDFDRAPPSADQYMLLITVNLLILHQWGLPPDSVNVHRECMVGRTCPGKYLSGPQIRADLWKPAPPPPPAPHTVIAGPHGALARTDYNATAPTTAYFEPGTTIELDAFVENGYRHVAAGIGFVAEGDMVWA